jgi:tol-pal system protein YbgF
MRGLRRALPTALLLAASFGLPSAASAQLFGRPPADVPTQSPTYVQQGDAAGLSVRLERLESQIRTLTGQVEQLQNQNRRLEDQLKRFQQDVDFRFQEQPGGLKPKLTPSPAAPAPGKRSDAGPSGAVTVPGGEPTVIAAPSAAQAQIAPAPLSPPPQIATIDAPANPSIRVDPGTLGPFAGKQQSQAPTAAVARGRRGDEFDPSRAPDAPGAPRPLGAERPSAPLRADMRPAANPDMILDDQDAGLNGPLDLQNPRPRSGSDPIVLPAPPGASATAPLSPYEQAMADYKAGRYEQAEQEFKTFVEKNPRDRRVADAIYWRGETYLQRQRHADAAAQYLNVATNYSGSSRAPEALVRLGVALMGMGEREQACATFAEVQRKHPTASTAIRSADREIKRNKC